MEITAIDIEFERLKSLAEERKEDEKFHFMDLCKCFKFLQF